MSVPSTAAIVEQELWTIPLVDHHVHATVDAPPSVREFENLISESREALGPGQSRFDSSVGIAIGAYCGRLLTGARIPALEYFDQRSTRDERELDSLFLRAAVVSDWCIDTGHAAERLVTLDQFRDSAKGAVHEILRLESLAEEVLASGVAPESFLTAFRAAIAARQNDIVGFKSIAAYRSGFAIDWEEPSDDQVVQSILAMSPENATRLVDPTIISAIVHIALDFGKPLQFHVGLGDRDVDFLTGNPLLLRPLLSVAERKKTPVVLLHCAPFEREAGYLCQNYTNVYMDVGLSINLSGVLAAGPIRRALEWCPFSRLLYSSDAWGMPELHYLGAVLWRRELAGILAEWIDADTVDMAEALRIATGFASANAARIYELTQRSSSAMPGEDA